MADVITRFKLETNQFDSALRNAANGLTNITKQLSLAGKDFDKFAQKHVESARSLGQVESGANNLKDKLRDLVSAYNNVAKAYNNLTKEQQQGDFGKAMAASLDQLQSRITQTKNDLYSMSDSTKQAGGSLGSLNDIFGMSITKIAGWGTAISAAKGALDVAKDAFMQSETNIDDWGRAVEGAEGAYNIFLSTLNNGNWSNFFTNLTTAIKGAMDLYDALDRLGSIKSNNQAAIAIVQAEIQQLRVRKQQGEDVDDQIKQATQRLKALKSQSVEAGKTAGTISMREVIRNEANSIKGGAQVSDRSINAAIDGIVRKGQAEFDKYRKNVEVFEKHPRFQSEVAVNYTTSAGTQTTYVKQFDINKLTEEQQRQYKLSKAITEGETRIQEGISIYAQAVQEGAQSAREEFRNNRYALQGNGTGSGKTSTKKTETELKQNEAAVAKLTEEYQKLATDAKTANDVQLSGIKERQTAIQTEIANLKARNEELKKFAAEAQGIQVNIGVNSSLPDLTAKLKELQAAQSQALNGKEWQEYQKQIEQVNLQIDAMKGKWKDGMKATISVNTESIQKAIGESSKLQDLITKPKKQTSPAAVESNANNVSADASKLEDVITKQKKGTATIDSNIKEVAADASNLEDVITKPKKGKVTIESNTEHVAADASKLEDVVTKPKKGTATIDSNIKEVAADASNLEDIVTRPKKGTANIDSNIKEVAADSSKLEDIITKPKTGKVTITADTSDAKSKIEEVDAMVGDKTAKVTFTADNAEVLQKAAQVDGIQIDPKTLTVTALTADAENALSNIEGLTLQPKELDITADVQKVLDAITQIDGVTVDPKTLEITADTLDAFNKLQELFNGIEGSTVQFEVVPNLFELSNNNITAIISDIKKKIDSAEIGSDLYNNLTERLADATAIGNLIKIAIQNGLDITQLDFTEFWANIIKGEDIPDTQLQSIVDRINNYLQEKHIELNMEVGTVTEKNDKESEGENKTGKSKNSKWKKSQTDDEGNPYAVYGLGKMSNGMNSLVSSVEQLGIELPQGLKDIFGGIQAVTGILTSIMTIVEAIEMLSSATSFMPFFAQGGIIPHAAGGAFIGGTHFSGDVTPVLANAGELILNKASQGNLVSQLQTNDTNTGNVAQPFITGEQIYLGLNNYLRRIGKGELLTARR